MSCSLAGRRTTFITNNGWRKLRQNNFGYPHLMKMSFESDQVSLVNVESALFEPVVNLPALSSFLVIAVLFALLQFRINGIRQAVILRTEAREKLRRVKALELSSDDVESTEVELAKQKYEVALRQEEELRTLLPGVRLVAPNNPGTSNEDVAAAKQFLDLDLSNTQPNAEDRRTGLPLGAKVVLGVVALTQIALLYVLSFDPMTSYNTFTTLGGGIPPSDLPLSSW